MRSDKKMKPVILKISGEALSDGKATFSKSSLDFVVAEIRSLLENNILPLIILGGGNVYRGRTESFTRVSGDQMGMLATLINAIALSDHLNGCKIRSCAYSSIEIDRVLPLFTVSKIKKDISEGILPVFGGGTANPFFSTDTLAALRACELGIDLILKGSTVEGVFDDDPKKNKNAKLIKKISFEKIITMQFEKIFDLSAFHLAKQNRTDIVIYDFFKKGNTLKAHKKETGTYITWGK